jgi:hypothetical protein
MNTIDLSSSVYFAHLTCYRKLSFALHTSPLSVQAYRLGNTESKRSAIRCHKTSPLCRKRLSLLREQCLSSRCSTTDCSSRLSWIRVSTVHYLSNEFTCHNININFIFFRSYSGTQYLLSNTDPKSNFYKSVKIYEKFDFER